MRRFVAYIHDSDTTLNFDMKVKFIGFLFSCPVYKFFLIDIGLIYLAHGCNTIRRCVAYIHDPVTTLSFDLFDLNVFYRLLSCLHVRPVTSVSFDIGIPYIWHMSLLPWEDVSSTFMILLRPWTLTSRSNLYGEWHGFVFRPQFFMFIDIVIRCLASEWYAM